MISTTKFRSDDPACPLFGGEDTEAALSLYTALTFGPKEVSARAFDDVLHHPRTTVFGAGGAGALLGIATLHLLPNVTWNGRPY